MSERREFRELNPVPELTPVGLSFRVEKGYYDPNDPVVRFDKMSAVEDRRVVTAVQELQVAVHFGSTKVTRVPDEPPVAQKVIPGSGGATGQPVIQTVEDCK